MTDSEKEMESYLSRFRRRLPPPGFKEQLLRRLEERRKLERAMTPAMWKIAFTCLALIVIFLGANVFINRTEGRHLSALLNIKPTTETGIVQEDMPLIQAEIQELASLEKSLQILKGLSNQKDEARKRSIKDYFNLLNMKEEFNGS